LLPLLGRSLSAAPVLRMQSSPLPSQLLTCCMSRVMSAPLGGLAQTLGVGLGLAEKLGVMVGVAVGKLQVPPPDTTMAPNAAAPWAMLKSALLLPLSTPRAVRYATRLLLGGPAMAPMAVVSLQAELL
jgi:hypothetical protein